MLGDLPEQVCLTSTGGPVLRVQSIPGATSPQQGIPAQKSLRISVFWPEGVFHDIDPSRREIGIAFPKDIDREQLGGSFRSDGVALPVHPMKLYHPATLAPCRDNVKGGNPIHMGEEDQAASGSVHVGS